MELTILGGSAAAPNGGDASAGYLVTSGATTILIDCGSGVVSQLRARADAHALGGVIISHLHSDHTLDLVALRYALQYAPYSGERRPVPLHLPPGGSPSWSGSARSSSRATRWGRTSGARCSRRANTSPEAAGDGALAIGGLTVRFAPMAHYIPVWALRIADDAGRSLTYSADTGPQAPLAAFAAGSDLLLCEATLLQQPRPGPGGVRPPDRRRGRPDRDGGRRRAPGADPPLGGTRLRPLPRRRPRPLRRAGGAGAGGGGLSRGRRRVGRGRWAVGRGAADTIGGCGMRRSRGQPGRMQYAPTPPR